MVSCVARWRELRWFSDNGVGSCKFGPGRFRFALEVVLDTEGIGGSELGDSCNRVDTDMAECFGMGVYGAVDA